MAEISKITLPSGNTYDIKDSYARQLLAGGLNFVICWDGTSTPVVANIPAGVVVTYEDTDYTGTKAASTAEPLTFYLVKSGSATADVYAEYAAIRSGSSPSYTYSWEKLGDTAVDLSSLGALAYKDTVALSKGSGDMVLGEATTFSVTQPTISVTPSTTSVPNVTSAGSASTWAFNMGTGTGNTETLIISGANGSAPTLGTAISVSNGITSATATGCAVSANSNDGVKVAVYGDLSVSVS